VTPARYPQNTLHRSRRQTQLSAMGVAALLLAITQVQIPELRAGAVKARSRARAHARSARSAEAWTAPSTAPYSVA